MKCVGSVRRDGFFMDIVVWAGQVMFAGPETSHFGRGEGGGSGREEETKNREHLVVGRVQPRKRRFCQGTNDGVDVVC